ncbi:MAG: YigZ family protein [Desulfotalea sp.]
MQSYKIPAVSIQTELVVKKSQFLCHIEHCPGRDHAHAFIEQIREKHPEANHNCWAFIAGKPTDHNGWGMNDDGEPKGCAGKPMFNVIQHSGIGEICVVVTRYFGGIKLGTGGMARAYSGAVKEGLEILKLADKHYYQGFRLTIPYNLHQSIEKILLDANSIIVSSDYGAQIIITADLREDELDDTLKLLNGFVHQGLQIEEIS